MYDYQKNSRYFAQIAGGLEPEGAAELASLGARNVTTAYRGIHFEATLDVLYQVSYSARLISQVLAPLRTFACPSDRHLYRESRSIDWRDFLKPDGTFAVFANVANSTISHSRYAALRVKDAVVDQFRDRTGQRPGIDTHNPDLRISLFIYENEAVLSVGTSAGVMHRRGYRAESLDAPMQETVAAAVLHYTGWDGETPLLDPMCGSGTLLAEALMRYCRIPSGYLHQRFGFENLPDFRADVWKRVRQKVDEQVRPLPEGLIGGSDLSAKAVETARANLRRLPFGDRVRLATSDFRGLPPIHGSTIVTNPPYGVRMGKELDLNDFYKTFGDFLKQRCTGSIAYVYFGKREYLKAIGLRAAWKKPLVSGALDGRLAKFELY